MSFLAIGITLGGVGLSAGLAYAMQPGPPKNPDLAGASRGQVEAEAETLAQRRAMEAAAQQGGTALKAGYTQSTAGANTRARLEAQIARLQSRIARAGVHRKGTVRRRPNVQAWEAQIAGLQDQLAAVPEGGGTIYLDAQGRVVPEGEALQSFAGFGEADVQGRLARQMAGLELELSKKYGTQFVEEARKQLELSDPEGTAARKLLHELLQQQAGDEPDRPVAGLLDAQVGEQLAAGRGLDARSQTLLDEAVRAAQASRGETGAAGDFAAPLTTGFEGQQRLDAAQQKALGWLASGATPEDVEYRREQQNLSNLGAFIGGRTPQSQFGALSGAQRGAAPLYAGQPLPGANPNAAATGRQAALQTWNIKNNAQAGETSPWIAGLSALLSAGSAAGNAGWQPLARQV